VPVTSTILLYEKGQGYPTFDPAQAKEYFSKVNDRVAELVLDTIKNGTSPACTNRHRRGISPCALPNLYGRGVTGRVENRFPAKCNPTAMMPAPGVSISSDP